MERLTFDGLFCDIAKCDETPGGTFCETGSCTQRKVWERLKEYEDAEQDGRLVVLPCNIGDTVYVPSYSRSAQKHFIAERKVEEIFYSSKRGVRPWIICCFGGWRFDNCDIGKTVFLTRKEAEAVLKGSVEG